MKVIGKILVIAGLLMGVVRATVEERSLQKSCSQSDLKACETLTAYYLKNENWDNAILLGNTLCDKQVMKGCTFTGSALLAKGKTKEGSALLRIGCDGFEPYACRSLGRMVKKANFKNLSYMYERRACQYGLAESCRGLTKPKNLFSPKGEELLKAIFSDCEDSETSLCKDKLAALDKCKDLLPESDCELIPGELSIFFRAKLLQKTGKLVLLNLYQGQSKLKEKSKEKRYSYDLKQVMTEQKPLDAHIYVYGFAKTCTKKFEKAKSAESTSMALYPDDYSHLGSRTVKNISAFFYGLSAADCMDPKFGYDAYAVANLDPENPSLLDIWKINRDGNLIHVKNGIRP